MPEDSNWTVIDSDSEEEDNGLADKLLSYDIYGDDDILNEKYFDDLAKNCYRVIYACTFAVFLWFLF